MTTRTYDVKCTGCAYVYEVFEHLGKATAMEGDANTLACPQCGDDGTERVLTLGKPIGLEMGTDIDLRNQLGRTFVSTRELDAYLDANDLEVMTQEKARAFKTSNREQSDKYAQSMGYADKEAYQAHIANPDSLTESTAAAREKEMNAYHDKHGNADRGTVDTGWRDALPTTE